MAQVFPLNVDDLSADEARVSLAGTLAALPDPWTLLRERRIGGDRAEPIEVVLIHPEIGVALVDEAPRDPARAAHRLRDFLDRQRFGEFFPGELPIVALSVAADEFEMLGERLAAAFEAAPRLSIADADWADAVIELLMVPDDLAMAPVGEADAPRMAEHATQHEAFDAPARTQLIEAPDEPFDELSDELLLQHELPDERPRERFDELSSEPVRRERFDDAAHDRYARSPSLDGDEPPLPLMVDWPFAASYQRRKRRGRIAALAVILLLLAGAGVAAWEYAGDDLAVAVNGVTPRAQDSASRSIEVPLSSQSSADQSAKAAANPAPSTPPPVPAAPPVVMAQKPYAPPPPSPPKATPVEPLPQLAQGKPPSPPPAAPPAQTAAVSPPSATPEDSGKAKPSAPQQKEPENTQTASAPPPPPEKPAQTAEVEPPAKPTAAPSPAKPKPARTAKAEAPPRRAEPARHEPRQASRPRPSEPSDNPPIDAADLPPLDNAPAPQRPTQLAAPSGSSQPAGGLGPPVPLWHSQQQANNTPPSAPQPAAVAAPASADVGNRECRPYTSSTTLTGRGLRVEGIACRGNDGQWRLVSEVPMR